MFPARSSRYEIIVAFVMTGTLLSLSAPVSAQDRGFPGPPPGRGPGGFGGPGRPGGPGGPGGGPRPMTALGIPANVLASRLKLSTAQKTKIAGIQKEVRLQREKLMPRPTMRDAGPSAADFDRMRINGGRLREIEQSAALKAKAVLTADQKKALPALLKEAETMRSVGLPLELADSLKLTAPQKTKIAAIAQAARREREAMRDSGDFRPGGDREKTQRQALAVLTGSQRKAVSAYRLAHPRPPFGGPPGGFRGGPGGGPPPISMY
ncbi:MAG: hypothetical protein V4671_31100 [Armatimonadota bacterium]